MSADEEMTPDKVQTLLYTASNLVVPSFRPKEGEEPIRPREKAARLEDHMILCARWLMQLERARLFMYDATRVLEDQWEAIEGYEMTMGKEKTQKAVVEAKRKLRPDLYGSIRTGKALIARLSDQIRRIERDQEVVVSRVFTMISGS
jgi:hypothetical protein